MAASPIFPRSFFLLWSVTFLAYFSFQLTTASLPLYAVSLGADDAAIGLLTGVIALGSLVSRPWVGQWLDRGGARWSMPAAGSLFAVSAVGFLVSQAVTDLIAFRILSGFAIALLATSSQVLAIGMAPEQRRGEALSLLSLALGIGQGAGPGVGIAVARNMSYQGLFATCAVLGVCSTGLALALRAVPPQPSQPRTARLIHPAVVIPGLVLVAVMITFGVNFGLLAVHASRRGLANPGLVFAAYAVGQISTQALLRRVSDRFGRGAAIGPGLVLTALGMLTLGLVSGWWLLLGALLAGAGQGMTQPAIYALGSDLVAGYERGSAMGTLGVFLEIGIAAGAIGGGGNGRGGGVGKTFFVPGSNPRNPGALPRFILGPSQLRRRASRLRPKQ